MDRKPITELQFQRGDLNFRYDFTRGVTLSVFGVPVIYSTSLWVMTPGWISCYYGMADRKELLSQAEIIKSTDSVKIILHHHSNPKESSRFVGREIFEIHKDNTYQVTLEGSLSKDLDGIIEWNAGTISPVLFIGLPYQATIQGNTQTHRFPVNAVSADLEASTFAHEFSHLSASSRIGPVEISCTPENDIRFFDFRKNRWANPKQPQFWLGYMELPIKGGTPFSHSLKFQFPTTGDTPVHSDLVLSEPLLIQDIPNALSPCYQQDYILPTPKEWKPLAGFFPLTQHTTCFMSSDAPAELETCVQQFNQNLSKLVSVKLPAVHEHSIKDTYSILISNTSLMTETFWQSIKPLPLPSHPEGYTLQVEDDYILISAHQTRGIHYGLSTLLQLLKVTPGGCGFKGADIRDYPALDFRGIHCFSGKGAGKEIAKAIHNLMGRFKINHLVWECEYLIWDSCPELAHPEYGMTKANALPVIQAAKNNCIDLIPLVQSLGHSEWMFTNGQNLELAEDPNHPYVYNSTDPRTYDFIFKVYQEALDFFQPKYFHIGHDEITTEGRFPYRSLSSGKSVTELVLEDIRKLYDWFTKQNIRIMIWGDMFLWREEANDAANAPSAAEAVKRRQLLHKDIIITDWHYAEDTPENYKSLQRFKSEGFDTIGAPFDRPNNIMNLAKACQNFGCLGTLQTTWAGFNFKINGNESCWNQYWAYLLAAEYAWSGQTIPSSELPYDAGQIFMDLWSDRRPVLQDQPGFQVDLKPYYNCRLSDSTDKPGWVGLGTELDLSAFPVQTSMLGETHFCINPNESSESAILMQGRFNPPGTYPQEIRIPWNGKPARELHLLMTAAFPADDLKHCGELQFIYSDLTESTHPFIYGRNLFAFNDLRPGQESRIAWKATSRCGQPVAVRDVLILNTRPGKPIRDIRITSAHTEASMIIIAITGVY